MKFIGLGANLNSPIYGSPRNTLEIALDKLKTINIDPIRISPWYRSTAVPSSNQPDFVNAVAEVDSTLTPHELIKSLLFVESIFGRKRGLQNEARIIDLDLLVYDSLIITGTIVDGVNAIVPHPRMNYRRFVLIPLRDLSPDWIDPKTGVGINYLISQLPKGQIVEAL